PLVPQLKILVNQLQAYSSYHPDMPLLLQRLRSVQIELQDIADEVDRMNDHINYDPEKIEEIDSRLSAGFKLLKKHGAKATNELLEIKLQLEKKLQAVLEIDEQLDSKGKETEKLLREGREKAAQISENR